MRGVQLHDKFTEDIIGTVILKEDVEISTVINRWDRYQRDHNSNLEDEADIHEFVSLGNWDICEVLELEFYQP